MSIQHWSEKIWIAQLSNEPTLSEELSSLRDQVDRHNPTPSVIVDMAGVTVMNSSNLSQLLRLRKLAIDGNARLLLTGLADGIWAVFLTTGLDKVFEFTQDVPNALATLQIK